jgi:hypothetical protein
MTNDPAFTEPDRPADDLSDAQAEYDRLAAELEALRGAGSGGTADDRTPEEAREHEVNLQRLLGDALRRLDAARRDAGLEPEDRAEVPIDRGDARSDIASSTTD